MYSSSGPDRQRIALGGSKGKLRLDTCNANELRIEGNFSYETFNQHYQITISFFPAI